MKAHYNCARTMQFHSTKTYGFRTMFSQPIDLDIFLAYGRGICMPSHVSKMDMNMARNPVRNLSSRSINLIFSTII